jgi:hypothetical protein
MYNGFCAHVAQLVEHILGKDEVTGSIPVMGFVKAENWCQLLVISCHVLKLKTKS